MSRPPTRAQTRSVVAILTMAMAASALPSAAAFEGWFDASFSVELVTTVPGQPVPERSLLIVGDGYLRLAGASADVPFVVLYHFAEDVVSMAMLDPISHTAIGFDFDTAARPMELDVLAVGALLVPPDHVAHPCQLWPAQASCSFAGVDELYGLAAERWQIVLDDTFGFVESFDLWVDPFQRRVRRLRYEDGTQVDLGRYDLGPRPAELFRVPDEYEWR